MNLPKSYKEARLGRFRRSTMRHAREIDDDGFAADCSCRAKRQIRNRFRSAILYARNSSQIKFFAVGFAISIDNRVRPGTTATRARAVPLIERAMS